MKFSLWTQYGAMNSKPVFNAFEKSLKDAGHSVVHNNNNADVNVIGRRCQNDEPGGDNSLTSSDQSGAMSPTSPLLKKNEIHVSSTEKSPASTILEQN